MDSPGDDPGDRDGSMARPDPGRGDNGNELSHKYQGPQWDARKDTYPEWWWEAAPYLDSLGLEQVRKGRNRGVLSSPETKEAIAMLLLLSKLFRVVVRMVARVGTEALALRLMIRAEFGEDRDGYLLLVYIEQYANDVSTAEVKVLKNKLAKLSFNPVGSPAEWEL